MSNQDTQIIITVKNGNSHVKFLNGDTAAAPDIPADKLTAAIAAKRARTPDPVNMLDVQQKLRDFQLKMQQLADVMDSTEGMDHLRIQDRSSFFTHFFIDKAAIARLNAIAAQKDFRYFSVFFGLEDGSTKEPLKDPKAAGLGQLTCCFVGMDDTGMPLEEHFPPTATRSFQIKAEETWPPPPPPPGTTPKIFSLTDNPDKVAEFFDPRS